MSQVFRSFEASKEAPMDITKEIARMKEDPDFAQNVGMVLVHNGVVRAWSRADRSQVSRMDVRADLKKIEALRAEYSKRPGIYKIVIEAKSGSLKPGDDLLFIIVAGDIREHVKPVLSEILDRIKSEAVVKTEHSE
jgi:molybdopterin synthase catalytic subunit